ncbi:MAG: hypothetical protein K0R27_2808 [Xanthobacteraceae bacterium]|nr:hypothetical protein [Xanthobacteraceae bacterium]
MPLQFRLDDLLVCLHVDGLQTRRPGAPWRDVPPKYGSWNTIYRRLRWWSEAGIWETVAVTLAEIMADSGHYSDILVEGPWLDRFCNLMPSASAVLDIGCGSGLPIASELIRRGFEVTGVDGAATMLAPTMLSWARQSGLRIARHILSINAGPRATKKRTMCSL